MAVIHYKQNQLAISLLFLILNCGVRETQDGVCIPRNNLISRCSCSKIARNWRKSAQGQSDFYRTEESLHCFTVDLTCWWCEGWMLKVRTSQITEFCSSLTCYLLTLSGFDQVLIWFWSRLTMPLLSIFFFFYLGRGVTIIIATIGSIITSLQWFF